jgi:hypothetical protein
MIPRLWLKMEMVPPSKLPSKDWRKSMSTPLRSWHLSNALKKIYKIKALENEKKIKNRTTAMALGGGSATPTRPERERERKKRLRFGPWGWLTHPQGLWRWLTQPQGLWRWFGHPHLFSIFFFIFSSIF